MHTYTDPLTNHMGTYTTTHHHIPGSHEACNPLGQSQVKVCSTQWGTPQPHIKRSTWPEYLNVRPRPDSKQPAYILNKQVPQLLPHTKPKITITSHAPRIHWSAPDNQHKMYSTHSTCNEWLEPSQFARIQIDLHNLETPLQHCS